MGGNIALLAWQEGGVAAGGVRRGDFSVPCDLGGAAQAISRPGNKPYLKRFLIQLREHIAAMAEKFPIPLSLDGYDAIHDFAGFDGRYTAPLHGFQRGGVLGA